MNRLGSIRVTEPSRFCGIGLLGSVGSGYVVRMPRASKLV